MPDIDLLREVAAEINKKGWNVNIFSTAIRHRNMLYDRGLNDDQIDGLIENIDEYCYKESLSLQTFGNLVKDVIALSEKYGYPFDKLEEEIEERWEVGNSMVKSIRFLEDSRYAQLQKNKVTSADIEEYKKNRPLMETVRQQQQEIKDLKQKNYVTEIFADKDLEGTVRDTPKNMASEEVSNAAKLLLNNAPHLTKEIKSILKKAPDLQYAVDGRNLDYKHT